MKKADKISYRQKDQAELQKLLVDLQKKLVEVMSKIYTGSTKDTSVIKKTKYEIALIQTLLTEKQHGSNK
ncbi:MAG: 50S ribosomal protein L29 [Candidatus Shapirobacteria bacterium]|jgi:ribosomal protein L29